MGILPPTWTCRKCGKEKPSSEFHRDSKRSSGLHPYCKLCVRAYHDTIAPVLRQRNRDWQQANSEKVVQYSRKWAQNNPIKQRAGQHRRRALVRGSGGSFTADEWQALCDWFGNKCLACGALKITIDHVVPIVQGGTNGIENLQPLCGSCNASKNDRMIDYRNPDRLAAFLRIYCTVVD